jgi:arylsulfatase A-like enzyme
MTRSRTAALAPALAAILVACGSARERPLLEELNVLLVVVDTVGAEHVGFLNPGQDHTPHFDRLAREGVVFEHAYAPAPWTQPSLASLLTGRMPSQHALLRLFDSLGEEQETLAEALRARGFETAAVVSHLLLERRFGFAQGFDHYDASAVAGHDAITSRSVTDRALAWLDGRSTDAPFLLFVHYFDPHFAFNHHPEFDRTAGYAGPLRPAMDIWELRDRRDRLTREDLDYLVGLYREEIAYTDAQVGRLLDHVREGDPRPTLVILAADHGEEFMRHGWIGHTRTLYDELLRVPLVFHLPGVFAPRRVDAPVSLLDVLPTLLAFSSTRAPEADVPGISLAPALLGESELPRERELYAEVSFAARPEDPDFIAEKTAFKVALQTPRWKLIHDLLTDRWELYDRRADPEELNPLEGRPEEAALRRRLTDWERARPGAADRAAVAPSDDERARLRALGYLR